MTRPPHSLVAALACIVLGPVAVQAPVFQPIQIVDSRPNIEQMIEQAADRWGIPRARLIARARSESNLTDIDTLEPNFTLSCGPLQANEASFPGICGATLREQIDAGASYLAQLIRKHGSRAEFVYVHGHP